MSDEKFIFNKQIMNYFAKIMSDSGLSEMEIKHGDTYVRFAKNIKQEIVHAAQQHFPTTGIAAAPLPVEIPTKEDYITAPVVGKIYTAPQPDAAPFVKTGDKIEKGQTIFIIEAMKVMNNVKATKSGIVAKILIENAQPVEYGQPLILLK